MTIRNMVEKDSLANKYAADAPYGTLHTADPGTAGNATSEVSGGSPAYARKAISWSTASGTGVVSGAPVFDVPSGTTVAFAGVASTNVAAAATLRDSFDITDQAFASQGTFTVTYTYTQT